jgi:hypothetical protein
VDLGKGAESRRDDRVLTISDEITMAVNRAYSEIGLLLHPFTASAAQEILKNAEY